MAGTLAVTLALTWSPAVRADVQGCLAAADQGQRSRKTSKLREARAQFLLCATAACPRLVREDCSRWKDELDRAVPKVTFSARDKEGRALSVVTVSVDGETLVHRLDGTLVPVNPGIHTFRFEVRGSPPVTETAFLKEGDHSRVVSVTFKADHREGASETPTSAAGMVGPDVARARRNRDALYPWIVVGVGASAIVAGVVVLITAPSRPSNCSEATQSCTRLPGQSDAAFADDRERARTAEERPVLGFALGGIGVALAAGGLLWYALRAPASPPKKAAFRPLPWLTQHAAGFSVATTF